jgi:hypothetical protein
MLYAVLTNVCLTTRSDDKYMPKSHASLPRKHVV